MVILKQNLRPVKFKDLRNGEFFRHENGELSIKVVTAHPKIGDPNTHSFIPFNSSYSVAQTGTHIDEDLVSVTVEIHEVKRPPKDIVELRLQEDGWAIEEDNTLVHQDYLGICCLWYRVGKHWVPEYAW